MSQALTNPRRCHLPFPNHRAMSLRDTTHQRHIRRIMTPNQTSEIPWEVVGWTIGAATFVWMTGVWVVIPVLEAMWPLLVG
jgi:hypothetical protein